MILRGFSTQFQGRLDNMNNSTADTAVLVQQINDEKVKVLLPVIVYIAVLMMSGLVGNLMVCFYYAFKTKRVPTSIFIVAVTIYDLIFCAISMPVEIAHIARFYTFKSGPACKIFVFISHTASIASALTLVIIAMNRFKHIRRSTQKQTTEKDAKKNCVIVAIVAAFVSCPLFIICNAELVPVPNDLGLELQGYDCTFVKDESYKPIVWVCTIILVLGLFVCTVIMVVLYSIVAWTIKKQRNRLSKYQHEMSHSLKIRMSSIYSDKKKDGSKVPKREDDRAIEAREAISKTTHTEKRFENIQNQICSDDKELDGVSSAQNKCKSETVKGEPQQRIIAKADVKVDVKPTRIATKGTEKIRITILMIVIALVFVISFLPFLSLIIWQSVTGVQKGELSNAELIVFELVSRSFLLNSSVNPWIYGICNSRFRMYYYSLFWCKS